MVQMFPLINIMNCLPPLCSLCSLSSLCSVRTRFTILTNRKKQSQDKKIGKTGQLGSRHSPLGLQIYIFINSENYDCIDYLGGRGGSEKERMGVNRL